MSSHLVTPPRTEARPSRLYLSVATVVAAALLAVAVPSLHAEVTIEGEQYRISQTTTVGDFVAAGVLDATPGDLLDIEGDLLFEGGGRSPVFFVNGRKAPRGSIVLEGDRISSRRGGDVTEATKSSRSAIPIPVQNVGEGPLISLESPGSVGVMETVVGTVSDKLVSTRELEPAQPMVLRRWVPDPGSRVVALTFDDGPWPGQTEAVLDILAEHEVPASFFMVGYLADRYPALAKRVADEGHVIGNHSATHKILNRHDGETIRNEIVEGSLSLREATGVMPRWFRPPGGGMNAKVLQEAQRINMSLVMWDADPRDWKRPGVEPMLNDLLKQIGPGSVVLLHDGGGDRSQTIELLPLLIEELRARDYVFVTLDQLKK